MNSFKTYFKKEVVESIRKSRYLLLGIGFIFWAVLNPLILKLMPYFIKGQVPDLLLEELSDISKMEAIQNYMGDVFSIGILFTVFVLMGIISEEVNKQKLILPYSKGVNPAGMVLAKSLHYIIVTAIFIFLAFLINYYYVLMFFTGESLNLSQLLPSISLFIVYYIFIISFLVFLSSVFEKGIVTGIIALLLSFGLSSLQSIKPINIYIPNYLIARASQIGQVNNGSLWITVVISLVLSILFNLLAVYRMKKVEIV